MSREIPEPWASAMERKGFMHNGRPSVSRLASKAELAVETARRMIHRIGTPEQRNINKVADALGVPRVQVSQWAGLDRGVEESYTPPPDADLMTREQRDAVDRVIQLFVAERRSVESGPDDNVSRPTFGAGGKRGRMQESATTQVDAAHPGERQGEMKNRSTKPPSPLGGAEPDDDNQDRGDDDWSGA